MGKRAMKVAMPAAASPSSKKPNRSQKDRRDIAAKVARAMQDKVYGRMEKYRIDTFKHEGMTVKERLFHEYDLSTGNKLSPSLWNDIEGYYQIGTSVFLHFALPVAMSSGDSAPDELVSALELACTKSHKDRDIERLVVFLQYADTIQPQHVYGTLLSLEQAKWIGRVSQQMLYVEVMKHLARAAYLVEMDALVKVAKPLFDGALLANFMRLRAKGMSWEKYAECYQKVIGLVAPLEDVEAVFACSQRWETVAPQLARLVKGSLTGAAIYKTPRDAVASACISDKFKDLLLTVVAADYQSDAIKQYKEECDARTSTFTKSLVAQQRTTSLVIGHLIGSMSVSCPSVEADVALQCSLKSNALGKKYGLKLFDHEIAAGYLPMPDTVSKVPSGMLEEMHESRRFLAAAIKKQPPKCFEDLRTLFNKEVASLWELDRSVRIEHAMLDTEEKAISERAESAITRLLPTEDKAKTVNQAVNEMKLLLKDDMYNYASLATQRKIEAVYDVVSNLQTNVGPHDNFAESSPFYAKVLNLVGNFVRCKTGDESSEDEMVGKPALDHMFSEMETRMSAEATSKLLTLEDVEIFHQFKFLLSDAAKKKLGMWVRKILQMGKASGSAEVASSSSGPAPPPSGSKSSSSVTKSKKEQGMDTTRTNIMRFMKSR
jgi:hypothetical protein